MPFHSPPNWPKPPSGWEPGPDWRPDPLWPPPPPDWVFWTDEVSADAAAATTGSTGPSRAGVPRPAAPASSERYAPTVKFTSPGALSDPKAPRLNPEGDPTATQEMPVPVAESVEPLGDRHRDTVRPSVLGFFAPPRNMLRRTNAGLSQVSTKWQRAVAAVGRLVNPIRLGYAAATVAGVMLFGWLFSTLRFTTQWNYGGWLWQGIWPVAAMLAGLVIGLTGIIGVHRWDHARWRRRREGSRRVERAVDTSD